MRTSGNIRSVEFPVSSSLGSSGLGMSSFRQWHFLLLNYLSFSCLSLLTSTSYCLLFSDFKSFSFSQRGSICSFLHSQVVTLKSVPQVGQSPLQSSWHSDFKGTDKIKLSLTRSSSLKKFPVWTRFSRSSDSRIIWSFSSLSRNLISDFRV